MDFALKWFKYIFILLCYCSLIKCQSLINGEEYLLKLARTMIENMEAKHIVGNALPMADFVSAIEYEEY